MAQPDCIMLAAGRSRRMEQWKMTLPLGGGTLIERSVGTALEACGRVILVAGYRADELAALFRGNRRVEVFVNPSYEEGMLTTVRRGCREVRTPWFYLALGDMPAVDPETYRVLRRLAEGLAAGEGPRLPALIPRFRGKKGHPLLLSDELRARILQAPATATLRDVLAEVPNLLVPVEDAGVLNDVDTPDDYRGLVHTES